MQHLVQTQGVKLARVDTEAARHAEILVHPIHKGRSSDYVGNAQFRHPPQDAAGTGATVTDVIQTLQAAEYRIRQSPLTVAHRVHQAGLGRPPQRRHRLFLAQRSDRWKGVKSAGDLAKDHADVQRVLARVADQRLLLATDAIDDPPCPGGVHDTRRALVRPHLHAHRHALAHRDDPV